MWDALDSEHKNVYKKKTEAAKKEYLKALAAYRASLVSKGAGENEGMYGNYGNYGAGPPPQYNAYSPQNTLPSPPMTTAPTPPINQQQPAMSKKPMMSNMNNQPHQGMMQSLVGPVPNHMNMTQHIQQQHNNSYMQQVSPDNFTKFNHDHLIYNKLSQFRFKSLNLLGFLGKPPYEKA